MISSVLIGAGSYLPKKVMTNDDLSKIVDTNDEWISTRTGIRQRHIAATDEMTSDMAAMAVKRALKDADLSPKDVDLLIVATTTPDMAFPSVAAIVQKKTKLKNAFCFDVQAVCSGFVYAMDVADSYIKTGKAKTVVVVGAEKMSKIVDWTDRSTCVLFGDGAGAFVLKAEKDALGRGILQTELKTDGSYADILVSNPMIEMDGGAVYRNAVSKMADISKDVLKKAKFSGDQVDWLIPHQANLKIIHSVGKKLKIPNEKVCVTVDQQANTSAATIPLAFVEYYQKGQIKRGDLILMTALGGGLTWGSLLMRY